MEGAGSWGDLRCPVIEKKHVQVQKILKTALDMVRQGQRTKLNLIWLEATGCSGNIISLLNAEGPDVGYVLTEMVNLRYNNSLMAAEGEMAFAQLLETLATEFVLAVEGAVSTESGGLYTVVARYQGQPITAADAVRLAGERAKYVLAVGTCASHGGTSAARPNPSGSMSVAQFLRRPVIQLPGCPAHPDWVTGTLAHLLAFGLPELDAKNRPKIFYGLTIHDRCPRRSYFDLGVFARKLGDPECMFKLGCRGPVTHTDCPVRKWNDYVNWPIGDNTPCIGCAREGFPDGMEPFVRY